MASFAFKGSARLRLFAHAVTAHYGLHTWLLSTRTALPGIAQLLLVCGAIRGDNLDLLLEMDSVWILLDPLVLFMTYQNAPCVLVRQDYAAQNTPPMNLACMDGGRDQGID